MSLWNKLGSLIKKKLRSLWGKESSSIVLEPVSNIQTQAGGPTMSFWEKVASHWERKESSVVYGPLPSLGTEAAIWQQSAGKCYLQLRCAQLSVQFGKERGSERRPLLQSLIRWPHKTTQIAVSSTLGSDSFREVNQSGFAELIFDDVALSGELPLNAEGNDVEVSIAFLSVPGTSIFDRSVKLLASLASFTKVPQLTQAAPIAEKVASGIDEILGNEEAKGLLAYRTSIDADQPKSGYFVVTDWASTMGSLDSLRVNRGKLEYQVQKNIWADATGQFSFVLLEFRVEGPKKSRWNSLSDIFDLYLEARTALIRAETAEAISEAGGLLLLAGNRARASADLILDDANAAMNEMMSEWATLSKKKYEVNPPVSPEVAAEAAAKQAAAEDVMGKLAVL